MKKFLRNSIVFFVIVVFMLTILLNRFGGYVDFFYEKFTTPKQFSMILGDSRAMQGIQPKVLDSCLKGSNYKLPAYNFSFTIAQASYGPSYLNAIKRKLDTTANNQLFIITVNPWMLSNRQPELIVESDELFKNMPPHNINYMNISPNFEYLIKNFNYFHFKAIIRKKNKLHKNGWLQENNLPANGKVFLLWKNKQIEMFNGWSTKWNISNFRLRWLSNTILYLKHFGNVVVVRMPMDEEILNIENKYWNNFDQTINKITVENSCAYLNFSKDNVWNTYDGHHLDKYGGKLFSKELSKMILNAKI